MKKHSFGQYETFKMGAIFTTPNQDKQNTMVCEKISLREREVLYLIAFEYSSKEIAAQLFISTHTVLSHRKNLLAKLCAKNTAGLIRRAFEEHIFSEMTT